MTPSSTGSCGPDSPGTHLLPYGVCTSSDTSYTCLRFASKIPNCTKPKYLHVFPKHQLLSVISFLTCKSQVYLDLVASHAPAHATQPVCAPPAGSHTVQGPATASARSLLQINPVLHHLSTMLECYHYPAIIFSFLISRFSHFLQKQWSTRLLKHQEILAGYFFILLTFKTKHCFIIMQIESTLL